MQTLQIDRLLTERLILIPFTIQICKNIINDDFGDLSIMGLKKGKSWPDTDVIETLLKIINNLSQVESPTGFESWMIIKKDTLDIISDLGFKGFNHNEGNIDIGYGIIKEERKEKKWLCGGSDKRAYKMGLFKRTCKENNRTLSN